MTQQWIEGVHYYLNDEGLMVLTEKFHRERGYCCGRGCLHCPYSYEKVEEPRRSKLLQQRIDNPADNPPDPTKHSSNAD